ncbi:MAG TPA: prephenate dehydrogenase/arogenate dehydrogenase family protein, partial [Spirochaetota bacterium]|nr:prephenate dehydrogenase/arogenate dehydrogenase family protein [Spirochaetota bacterium]
IELMLKYLPMTTEIIGTHPLFGPQSAKGDLKDLNIVLTNVRSTKFENVKNFLESKYKLNILIEDRDNHDKTMAMVQGLTHYIAKALKEIGIYDTPLKTISYDNLLKF